ncbi:MAG: hypothetical protein ACJ0FT_02305 [Candidatus Actinomarina sp.]
MVLYWKFKPTGVNRVITANIIAGKGDHKLENIKTKQKKKYRLLNGTNLTHLK